MAIEDITVIEEYLSEKLNEKFSYIQTAVRDGHFKSYNYKIHLKTSFIDNVDFYKDSIKERLDGIFENIKIEKNKEYVMSRSDNAYIITPYYEVEI